MTATELAAALSAVEARVSYLRSATAAPLDDGWIAAADLVAGGPSLADLMATTGAERGAHDAQVAASLFAQAYAFRVGGVPLAAYALGLPVPSTEVAYTAIKIVRSRPAAVAYLDPAPREPDAVRLAREFLGGHLTELIAAIRTEVVVGERLLWGNVAASCAVAFRAVEGESPDDRAEIRSRADEFFAASSDWLAGLGQFVTIGGRAKQGWFWERTNCCLWYQASGGSMCDDCSLHDPEVRTASWQAECDRQSDDDEAVT